MKKIISIILVLISIHSNSQYTIKMKNGDYIAITSYDSLKNYTLQTKDLIGQKLFVKPKMGELRKYGYRGFYTTYQKNLWSLPYSKQLESTYCPNNGLQGYSNYDSLVGRYFIVTKILTDSTDIGSEFGYSFLKLKDEKTQEVLYYHYGENLPHDDFNETDFPFIISGYFEKLKMRYVNKSYTIHHSALVEKINILNGKKILFKKSKDKKMKKHESGWSAWKCVDIQMDDNYQIVAIMIDELKQKIQVPISTFINVKDCCKYHDGKLFLYEGDKQFDIYSKYKHEERIYEADIQTKKQFLKTESEKVKNQKIKFN